MNITILVLLYPPAYAGFSKGGGGGGAGNLRKKKGFTQN